MELRKDISHELPSPHISFQPLLEDVLEILEIVEDEEVSFEKLARAMENRVSIAAAVMRTANSASLGSAQQARSLKHALALIGLQKVRNLLTDMKLEILGQTAAQEKHVSA